ncbi:hypothetical protein IFM89_017910 [Coptis chinensis]|uniref:CSD domain-containing protein n=1 Tax=Coptis chinensis TaxID=261450 RepID=A0A835IWG8_9MAGN|nr:hypothetical protein IFM89_017910 [Coptis chinensis]
MSIGSNKDSIEEVKATKIQEYTEIRSHNQKPLLDPLVAKHKGRKKRITSCMDKPPKKKRSPNSKTSKRPSPNLKISKRSKVFSSTRALPHNGPIKQEIGGQGLQDSPIRIDDQLETLEQPIKCQKLDEPGRSHQYRPSKLTNFEFGSLSESSHLRDKQTYSTMDGHSFTTLGDNDLQCPFSVVAPSNQLHQFNQGSLMLGQLGRSVDNQYYVANSDAYHQRTTILSQNPHYGLGTTFKHNEISHQGHGFFFLDLNDPNRPRVPGEVFGIVKWFNNLGGYGFITPSSGGEDVFVHYSLIKSKDRVPAFSPQKARAFIENELGTPVDVLFKKFEDQPTTAASLGQVHRAILHNGEIVVVKVQRPGLKKLFDIDLLVPSDLTGMEKVWSKPIKGSPYPRCGRLEKVARPETSRTKSNRSKHVGNHLYLEHNHPWPTQRNALVGSTRTRPPKNNVASKSSSSPQTSSKPKSLKEEHKDNVSNVVCVVPRGSLTGHLRLPRGSLTGHRSISKNKSAMSQCIEVRWCERESISMKHVVRPGVYMWGRAHTCA